MRIALYQPDIPQNTGAVLRLAACLGLGVDIIRPCGFPLDDRRIRRSGMDYADHVSMTLHDSWEVFQTQRSGRLILLTTRGSVPHTECRYQPDDILLLGRESVGVPENVHAIADVRVRIPIAPGLRSLNLAVAAAMVTGEALRQTGGFSVTGP
ncbi:MAG: tRNA (cytidine(34)-2'-O)-methyltransferase [Pseudomonadota bacterium]|nr:tRNA (cytidine(34)-2'-O)-methyltransferase [Pseudomonadota bacterium]